MLLLLVDWFAGRIADPVQRLRFLRSAGPRFSRLRSSLLVAIPAALLFLTGPTALRSRAPKKLTTPLPASASVRVDATPEIWQVESTKAYDTYSNGLRIDNRFIVPNHPRSYLAFSATRPDDFRGVRHSNPAGIVFHTTESLQAPFEAGQNAEIERIGESLLAYVKLKRAYNFLIDRFGRVYRVVPEADSANHAGYSIWSDAQWIYLNLNESFLAVSFETRTLPGQSEAAVSPAQIRAAAILTDMLRKRFSISSGNCVTHAQVSVNPSSLRIGYHLDWASSLPFAELGLPDSYSLPLPAITLFGFDYDSGFTRRGGPRLYEEAQIAEQVLVDRAAAAGMQLAAYKRVLQRRYRIELAAVRAGKSGQTEQEE